MLYKQTKHSKIEKVPLEVENMLGEIKYNKKISKVKLKKNRM